MSVTLSTAHTELVSAGPFWTLTKHRQDFAIDDDELPCVYRWEFTGTCTGDDHFTEFLDVLDNMVYGSGDRFVLMFDTRNLSLSASYYMRLARHFETLRPRSKVYLVATAVVISNTAARAVLNGIIRVSPNTKPFKAFSDDNGTREFVDMQLAHATRALLLKRFAQYGVVDAIHEGPGDAERMRAASERLETGIALGTPGQELALFDATLAAVRDGKIRQVCDEVMALNMEGPLLLQDLCAILRML